VALIVLLRTICHVTPLGGFHHVELEVAVGDAIVDVVLVEFVDVVLVDVVFSLILDVVEMDDLLEVELVDFVERLVVETLVLAVDVEIEVLALVEDVVWTVDVVEGDVTFARSWREANATAAKMKKMRNRNILVI
jgi:hypothetical protein